MASGLRAKLKAMGAMQNVGSPAQTRGGLECLVERRDVEDGLFSLSRTGLRRIGWNGRAFDVQRCLFLDTETTGLSGGAGTVAFLVGVGFVEGDAFVIEQYMMHDYSDEPELLDRLASRMDAFDSVCTFNGRTFDMPLLEARFTLNRMRARWREMENLDLLYPSRRAWKLRLGSCRLARLEEEILGMPREDDLPGSEAPKRFFDFLKTGDRTLLDDVVRHNRQDIATLATLLTRLCETYAEPETLCERADVFSIGKTLEKQGELKNARELYRISAIPAPAGTMAALTGERVAGMANWRLYLLARRSKDVDSMQAILEQMLVRRQMAEQAHTELAKLMEHRRGDVRQALTHARAARACCAAENASALDVRIARLERKAYKEKTENQRSQETFGG